MARQQGIPDDVIRQRVQQQFGVDINEPVKQPSLFSGDLKSDRIFSSQGLLPSVVNALASPFLKSGRIIGGAGYEVGREVASRMGKKDVWQGENPFLSPEELTQAGESPGKFIFEKGIKPGAGVASWGIPVGKGAGFAKQFVIPGAKIGALQGLSTGIGKNAEEVVLDIGNGAVKGAAFSAAIGVLSKAFGRLGTRTQEAGSKLREGVRGIREPASIYGARSEREINQALNKLGIKGSPQSQYEQLEPVYRKLSENISQGLANKPDVPFDTMQLKKAMLESVNKSGQIRTGVMTTAEAEKAVDDYIIQIMSTKSAISSFGNTISGPDLFNIKMNVMNPDVSKAYDALAKGQSLSTTQKILKNIRDSVDDVLALAYPDVKEATVLQSKLYDAADSLNVARKTVPTFRIFGITVPQSLKAGAQDITGRALQAEGRIMSGANVPNLTPALAGATARIGATNLQIEKPDQYPQNSYAQPNQQAGYDQTSGQFNHGNIVPQSTGGVPPTPTVASDIDEKRLKLAYLMYRYPKQASQLKTMFETLYPGTGKELSVEGQKVKGLVNTGIRSANEAWAMYQKDPLLLTKQLIPGKFGSRAFDKAMYDAVDTLLRLRTGAQANPSEIRGYMERLGPNFGDSREVVQYKIESLIKDLNDYVPTPTTPGQFPSYPSEVQFGY